MSVTACVAVAGMTHQAAMVETEPHAVISLQESVAQILP